MASRGGASKAAGGKGGASSTAFAFSDAAPLVVNDAELDAELARMEAEMGGDMLMPQSDDGGDAMDVEEEEEGEETHHVAPPPAVAPRPAATSRPAAPVAARPAVVAAPHVDTAMTSGPSLYATGSDVKALQPPVHVAAARPAAPLVIPPAPTPGAGLVRSPSTSSMPPDAVALYTTLRGLVATCKASGIACKKSGKLEDAMTWLNAGKGYESDMSRLRAGDSVDSVKAAAAARRAVAERGKVWKVVVDNCLAYYKSRVADAAKIAARLRLPGLSSVERASLSHAYKEVCDEHKRLKEDLTHMSALAQHPSAPMPPAWRWEVISETVALTNDDISADDVEVAVVAVRNLKDGKGAPDKGADVHVNVFVPFTTAPTAAVTSPRVKLNDAGTADMTFVATSGMNRRSRLTLKACERRPLCVEVVRTSKGFLGLSTSTAVVARGAAHVDMLLSDASMHLFVPLHAPERIPDVAASLEGKSPIPAALLPRRAAAAASAAADGEGAHAEGERGACVVTLRLHAPLRDEAVKVVERRRFVMDPLPIIAAPAPAPRVIAAAPAAAPVVLPAAPAPATSRTGGGGARAPTAASAPAAGAPVLPAPAPAGLPPPSAQVAKLMADYDSAKNYTLSVALIDLDLARLAKMRTARRTTLDPEGEGELITDRIEVLQNAKTFLGSMIENGTMSMELYMAKCNAACETDAALEDALRRYGKEAEAAIVAERVAALKQERATMEQMMAGGGEE